MSDIFYTLSSPQASDLGLNWLFALSCFQLWSNCILEAQLLAFLWKVNNMHRGVCRLLSFFMVTTVDKFTVQEIYWKHQIW